MSTFIGNEVVYLLPGEIIVTSSPLKISTILGSCVSVSMFDQEKMVAGINHYLLPEYNGKGSDRLKFGDTSLADLMQHMIRKGARQEFIQAGIFGGSDMLGTKENSFKIGSHNIEIAWEFLRSNKLNITMHNTGGKFGRKLIFDTSNGQMSCRILKDQVNRPYPESSWFPDC